MVESLARLDLYPDFIRLTKLACLSFGISCLFLISFFLDPGMHRVEQMTARPVMACGSVFDILPDNASSSARSSCSSASGDRRPGQGGVKVEATTSDANHTAVEIGRRLFIRMTSGSADLNPCPMS